MTIQTPCVVFLIHARLKLLSRNHSWNVGFLAAEAKYISIKLDLLSSGLQSRLRSHYLHLISLNHLCTVGGKSLNQSAWQQGWSKYLPGILRTKRTGLREKVCLMFRKTRVPTPGRGPVSSRNPCPTLSPNSVQNTDVEGNLRRTIGTIGRHYVIPGCRAVSSSFPCHHGENDIDKR